MKSYRFISSIQCIFFIFIVFLLGFAHSVASDPWWSTVEEEEHIKIDSGMVYSRVLYQTVISKPVRAHILSVTGLKEQYLFGVLGSYGALFPTTKFAKQSGAIAAVNGGFFSVRPNRARGLVAAHGKILYPPHHGIFRATIGFNSTQVLFDWIKPEDIKDNRFDTDKEGWNDCHAAVAAGPIVVRNGTYSLSEDSSFNLEERHPRTAIGKNEANRIFLVVVDGRQPSWSAGVTLPELAEMFLAMKATDAMNLDGGGSSTMVIQDKVMNRPSDRAIPGMPGMERAVANVVAVFKRE